MLERLVWPLRKLAWKIDEKVGWPVSDATLRPGTGGWWAAHWPDLLLAVVLGAAAYLSRRHGLPTNGLWLDDSITAAGLLASPSEILVVSQEHPGFTAMLAGANLVAGDGDDLAYPALVAGVLGPPLLFLALRWVGYARALSLLMGAALVAAQTHIVYSGRVRTYTIDLLVVLAAMMVLPRLARISWRWLTVVGWVAVTSLLASLSVFATIAVSAAGLILLLHPTRDLLLRVVAVGAQAAVTGVLFLAQRATYDGEEHEASNSETWDTFVEFDPNPIRFAEEIGLHLRRLGETLANNPEWLALACALVALAGLAVSSFRRDADGVRARYLLLIVVVAFGASLAGKFPFGAAVGDTALSDGHRWSLWLIPVLAVGIALVLQRVRDLLAPRRALLFGFDTAAIAAAVLILVSAGPALTYPFSGKGAAAEYIEAELGPRDSVVLPYRADWSFAAETDFDATVTATPQSSIGFRPEFSDPRIANLGLTVDRKSVAQAVKRSERVFVYYAEHAYSDTEEAGRAELASSLRKAGFERREQTAFGDASIEVWRRPGPPADDEDATEDLVPWKPSESAAPGGAATIFDCEGFPSRPTAISSFFYTGPTSGIAGAEIVQWEDPGVARETLDAFRASDVESCLTAALQGPTEARLSAEPIEPPTAAGQTAAFRLVVEPPKGSGVPPTTYAYLVYWVRGDAALVIGTSGAVDQEFLSTVTESAIQLLSATQAG